MNEYPNPPANYVCPDELDSMIERANLSPREEAYCMGIVMEYRIVCRQIQLNLKAKEEKVK